MKKFFIALTIFFCVTGGNFVNAASFTESQFDKIFTDVTKNPAAAPENSATLDLNIDTLKEKFNGFVAPFLKNSLGVDDISAFEHIFMIKTYKIFPNDSGDTFANVFGTKNPNVAIVGVTVPDGGNFKVLQCCYTTPESGDEIFSAQLALAAFVYCVAPDVEVPTLMSELTAENSSGSVTKNGVKFSIAEDGNLNMLTAVKNVE
ncbi:MAG: hypothetical protein IKP64_06075 [Selenomonadaceae bacterium]|nr:hypothetical protein [Selenomonadaceae bacterium]MBR4383109.1 hypothetical protein [Selenomonadaceae bacterium]